MILGHLRRRFLGLGVFLAFAACDGQVPAPDSEATVLLGGDGGAIGIGVRAPQGYCVDDAASRLSDGFAVMVACARLTPEPVPLPEIDGFMTVQATGAGTAVVSGAEDRMRIFLETPEGQAVLSSRGQAADLTLHSVSKDQAVVTASFTDHALSAETGLGQQMWQGFFDINGRLTTVTLRSFRSDPLAPNAGLTLLHETINQIRALNTPISPSSG